MARIAITSEWSPKIDSAWVAIERAATWKTVAGQLAGDLEHVGQHQQQALGRREGRRQRAGLQRAMHRAGGAALALHLLHDRGRRPRCCECPSEAHSSASSAIVEDGVIGKIAQTSLTR